MFLLLLPALAMAGVGAGLASMFGSDTPSMSSIFNNITPTFSKNMGGPAAPKTGAFPTGTALTEGGGGIVNTQVNKINFNKNPDILKGLLSGKYGGQLDPKIKKDLLDKINASPDNNIEFDFRNLTPFLRDKLKASGAFTTEPSTQYQSTPENKQIYDFLRDQEMNRIGQQSMFNQSVLMPLMTNLAGAQGNAIGGVNRLMQQGFSELDPTITGRIDSAKQNFFQGAADNLGRQFHKDTGAVNQLLATQGVPLGRSSDSMDFYQSEILSPYTQQLGSLAQQTELLGRQFTDDALNQQRQALGAYLSVPTLNAATQGLEVPGISYDRAFTNPTDQWDPSMIAQGSQFANQFGLQKDQLRMSPYMAAIPSAIAASQQGGIGQSLGAIGGSILPLMAMQGLTGRGGASGKGSPGFFGSFGSALGIPSGAQLGTSAGSFLHNLLTGGK